MGRCPPNDKSVIDFFKQQQKFKIHKKLYIQLNIIDFQIPNFKLPEFQIFFQFPLSSGVYYTTFYIDRILLR